MMADVVTVGHRRRHRPAEPAPTPRPGPPSTGRAATLKTDAWLMGYNGDIAFAIVVQNSGGVNGGPLDGPLIARFFWRRSASTRTHSIELLAMEISWFSALCDDDYEFLGVPDPALQSSWEHCRDIALAAEAGGYDNLLLPSGYTLGIDSVSFAAAIAPLLRRMQLLLAVRMGEMWPPQLARQLATIDQILRGRLTVNIISSDLPGETLESAPALRGARSSTCRCCATLLDGRAGRFPRRPPRPRLDPPRIRPAGGCPPLYFGGLSENAREVAAQAADVFLMWPDTLDGIAETIADVRARAARHGRDAALRLPRPRDRPRHRGGGPRRRAAAASAGSRPTPASASAAARWTPARAATSRQTELRDLADDDGYVEANLWTGIGRARSGAGAAIVGDPDQVLAKLAAYRELGLEAFILSGYPHLAEADLFARHVLPQLDHGRCLDDRTGALSSRRGRAFARASWLPDRGAASSACRAWSGVRSRCGSLRRERSA